LEKALFWQSKALAAAKTIRFFIEGDQKNLFNLLLLLKFRAEAKCVVPL